MSDTAFTVRPLPGSNLKGAFRVHINPDALLQLQLKLGEVCLIIGEDGTRGAGIAWRAADKMGSSPKSQPIKMSEILRDTFGFFCTTKVHQAFVITMQCPNVLLMLMSSRHGMY